jgi:hypothetical protein
MSIDQVQSIHSAFSLLEVTDRQWLRDIENRPSGSQWGRFMPWQELAALDWRKLPEAEKIPNVHAPECDYYHVNTGLHEGALENIKLLSEFKDFDSIMIVQGAHGLELQSVKVQPRPTSEAWLVIGPLKDAKGQQTSKKIVRTAYPGRFAVSILTHPLWDGSYRCLGPISRSNVPVAVKGMKPID